jgi:probable phosphoglycerate mutase
MSQRLFLVRHGHTSWNESGRYVGKADVDLDDTGAKEATRLGRWAASADIDAIVTSPALRAFRTASIVGAQVGVAVRVNDQLRELDFGAAEGRTLEELRTEDPEAVARFEMDPVTYHMAGGESPLAALARMQAAVSDVLALKAFGALVVTHSHVLRLLICHSLSIPLARYRRLLPIAEHCAVTEFSVADGQLALRRFNAVVEPRPSSARKDPTKLTNPRLTST